ncbi:MAG: DNA-binding protein [Gammaproteobacteria bacterium]
MARSGIGYTEVVSAIRVLESKGIAPTIDAIRNYLGTGSKSTIVQHCKTWRLENPDATGHNALKLPEQLSQFVQDFYLQLETQANFTAEEAIAKYQEETEALSAELKTNQTQLTQNQAELFQALESLKETQTDLNQFKIKTQDLETKNTSLNTQVQEKTTQIQSLEKQYQQAQNNLEHYREAVAEQRLQERSQFEQEIQRLHQELQYFKQQVQNSLTEKQELLSALHLNMAERRQAEEQTQQAQLALADLKTQCQLQQVQIAQMQDLKRELKQSQEKNTILESQLNEKESAYQALHLANQNNLFKLESISSLNKTTEDKLNSKLMALEQEKLFLLQELAGLKAQLSINSVNSINMEAKHTHGILESSSTTS